MAVGCARRLSAYVVCWLPLFVSPLDIVNTRTLLNVFVCVVHTHAHAYPHIPTPVHHAFTRARTHNPHSKHFRVHLQYLIVCLQTRIMIVRASFAGIFITIAISIAAATSVPCAIVLRENHTAARAFCAQSDRLPAICTISIRDVHNTIVNVSSMCTESDSSPNYYQQAIYWAAGCDSNGHRVSSPKYRDVVLTGMYRYLLYKTTQT